MNKSERLIQGRSIINCGVKFLNSLWRRATLNILSKCQLYNLSAGVNSHNQASWSNQIILSLINTRTKILSLIHSPYLYTFFIFLKPPYQQPYYSQDLTANFSWTQFPCILNPRIWNLFHSSLPPRIQSLLFRFIYYLSSWYCF